MLTPLRWILLSDSIEWIMKLLDSSPDIHHQLRIKLIRFYEGALTSHYLSCWLFQSYLWYTLWTHTHSRTYCIIVSLLHFVVKPTNQRIILLSMTGCVTLISISKVSAVPSSSNTSLYSVPLVASTCIHKLSASHPCWSSKYKVQRAWIEIHTGQHRSHSVCQS